MAFHLKKKTVFKKRRGNQARIWIQRVKKYLKIQYFSKNFLTHCMITILMILSLTILKALSPSGYMASHQVS